MSAHPADFARERLVGFLRFGVELPQAIDLRAVAGARRGEEFPLKGCTAAKLVALDGQIDIARCICVTHNAERIFAALDLFNVFEDDLTQQDDPGVALAQVLLGAVRSASLGYPGHDVLTLDVIDDVLAALVA